MAVALGHAVLAIGATLLLVVVLGPVERVEARVSGRPPERREPIPDTDEALLAECDVETLRASTKGGQRANKVETGVRLRHGPSGITVTSHSSRSQYRNKVLAVEELRRRLVEQNRPVIPRTATKPTKASRRRRVEAKKQRSQTKALRRSPPE